MTRSITGIWEKEVIPQGNDKFTEIKRDSNLGIIITTD